MQNYKFCFQCNAEIVSLKQTKHKNSDEDQDTLIEQSPILVQAPLAIANTAVSNPSF